MGKTKSVRSKEPVRFVTAASLFDGHDAAINIIRRLLQDAGAEVVHLGHNRSVQEIVDAAIQEGSHAIAVSSYQGGHMEFFKYMIDLLKEKGCGYIKVFGGGGGVIVPPEIRELEAYGVSKIYSPEDGKQMGLKGMIDHMMSIARKVKLPELNGDTFKVQDKNPAVIGRLINLAESYISGLDNSFESIKPALKKLSSSAPVIGITGTGGSGKSSFIDELVRRFLYYYPDKTVAIIAIDPSRRRSGGALLGDRIRMNYIENHRVYMRSMATRMSKDELSGALSYAIDVVSAAGHDLVLIETSGIGQGGAAVEEISDLSIYVMTCEYGAPSQLEKIDMLDFADIVVINKFEHERSLDALRDVRKQYRRNHNIFDIPDEDLPIFGTVASRYNDPGTDRVFTCLVGKLVDKDHLKWDVPDMSKLPQGVAPKGIIPSSRDQYLREIAHTVRDYHKKTEAICDLIDKASALKKAVKEIEDTDAQSKIKKKLSHVEGEMDKEAKDLIQEWKKERERYKGKTYTYIVRDREIKVPLRRKSLSGLSIPRVALPTYRGDAEIYRWLRKENLPGKFPYTAGVFPFKRDWEDPKRQFAGEGTPERTNTRFHYLCRNDEAKRLSTAFDSVTLYGQDPDDRPDIFGKIGESGVSICTLDDMKKLYAGFDLCSPMTSVSMTINGPAPILTAMFFNTAIDQQVERFKQEHGKTPNKQKYEEIKAWVLSTVRGTVQADILKEDQGQNTCIFSIEFALKMMGDMQEFFIKNDVNNFYSISISGYHIAEAGANPISQLAFTLANGFTYVEYYKSRGMDINEFAKNFSFFFSSGMDPEYSVMGRVARRIWAIAMKYIYGADDRGQKMKCHVQTSGRSLHSVDIDFNDIRTTLQALTALEDRCNSLHTNAYDEAITTPTEESVRRAMAIQLIINREFGLSKNENPLQGSFLMEWLTDAVEEAVLQEFERISDRKGVLGAMEAHYQRSKIQDESLYYERLKHSGDYPIIGVNTFERPGSEDAKDMEGTGVPLTRATLDEKKEQLKNLKIFQERNKNSAPQALERLQEVALGGGNIFEELMDTVKVASLGQITHALYEVGGRYRRNM
ncbi:MAG: methylmalonyl-CoA mutase family protein [Deltaproteobacteria bacterium]|nr:methylmalonyl-CoA mutase family protein [Deltaproteobacteria bacterium]